MNTYVFISYLLQSPKALVKNAFKKVPIIGWTATLAENAFLERYFKCFSGMFSSLIYLFILKELGE